MRRTLFLITLFAMLLVFSGCQPGMSYQPKYKPLAPGHLFGNGMSAQLPVEGTVARGQLDAENAPQPAVTHELLARGRERFEIYCAVCHGRDGYGDGIVPTRGFTHPPNFHQARLRDAPDRYIFDVITHGFGAMFAYGDRVEPADRWAIVAYIRALQLSQNARLRDLSAGERQRLEQSHE